MPRLFVADLTAVQISQITGVDRKTANSLPVPDGSTICSDEWKAYDSLASAGCKRHYRVKHSDDVFANGRVRANGIENFWGVAKTRLTRFRGIGQDKLYLHLKETEFRFNHCRENLYAMLLKEFRKTPLNYP